MGSFSYHVGQRIKKYRKSRGYTIEQFSAMINKSKATVSKYENGTITIDVETLYDIARALDIDLKCFIDYQPPVFHAQSVLPKNFYFNQPRAYMYYYDGRVRQLVRSLLCFSPAASGDGIDVMLYLGVDDFRAGVLPAEKAAYVAALRREGHTVLMVGDGINDSPALSEADAGIAISDGAAIAREIADITIAADSLWELVRLRQLAMALMNRIQNNYRFVIGFNGALIGLGIVGILPPATSAMLHNLSTLGVSLHSMSALPVAGQATKVLKDL